MKASKLEEFQHNTEPNEASLSVKEAPDQSIARPEKVRAESKDFLNFLFFFLSLLLLQKLLAASVSSAENPRMCCLPTKTRSGIFHTHFHPVEA